MAVTNMEQAARRGSNSVWENIVMKVEVFDVVVLSI